MSVKKLLAFFILSVLSPILLIALPQDQEIFIDFESVSGEGTIFVGQEPNVITLIGFTVETLEDPALLHSGTKAITLGAGQEGRIVSERGIQFLEFYAGETTGAGKFEIRGQLNIGGEGGDARIGTVIGDEGVIEGLPTNISPGANPPLYSFVADSGIFLDENDFNFLAGITEVKFLNVTGKLVLDDLGFTLTEFPSNNTVYTTFDELGPGEGQSEPLVVGTSPNTASFDGGLTIAIFSGNNNYVRSFSTAYAVFNGGEATITFETPAYEVDFFGAQSVSSSQSDPDGSVEVYDTNDNLIATFTNLDGILRPEFKPSFITINADELGAPGGIKRLVLKDNENINPSFSRASIDDFGLPYRCPGHRIRRSPTR